MKFVAMPRYQMRKNALKKLLKNEKSAGKRLLEIGYGAGEIFSTYQKMGIRVEGYDFSELAYEYARENYKDDDVRLYKEEPEHDGQYDYVVACEVLEHIEDDVAALKEWKTYLSNTGKLIISVPAHQRRWGANDVYSGHYRRYERKELEEKFKKAGMVIEKIYTYDFPMCLFLDKMRDYSRGKKISKEHLEKSKEEFTKSSGVERNFSPVSLALSMPALWFPIIKFEELFYRFDWGSAYILIAKKK